MVSGSNVTSASAISWRDPSCSHTAIGPRLHVWARFAVRGDSYVAGVLGVISEVDDVELAEVEAAVGLTSFGRGRSYARANRVLKIEWDPDTETLTGSVVGQGALYDTAAFYSCVR